MSDFHFNLPSELIAQHPPGKRDESRLFAADGWPKSQQKPGQNPGQHPHPTMPFSALPALLRADDLLVFNASKVLPARLAGNKDSGGKVEILLERILNHSDCLAQLSASKSPKEGGRIHTAGGGFIVCGRQGEFFHLRAISKSKNSPRPVNIRRRFQQHGQTPLPPYIRRAATAADRRRYQTVYADQPGSVAAPTAGLHFSKRLLAALTAAGIRRTALHLHIGAGTFMPLRQTQLNSSALHSEHYHISANTARAVLQTKKRGGRVIAVGTTTLRALESAALENIKNVNMQNTAPLLTPGEKTTSLFIRPGFSFKVADALITNFHLPNSSLFMLVCAFGGTAKVRAAYHAAIEKKLRFYSYGDAMFLTKAPATTTPAAASKEKTP